MKEETIATFSCGKWSTIYLDIDRNHEFQYRVYIDEKNRGKYEKMSEALDRISYFFKRINK